MAWRDFFAGFSRLRPGGGGVWGGWIGLVAGAMIAWHACAVAPTPESVPDADSLLFGLERCRMDAECSSGVCSIGMCLGFLTVSTEVQRARIGTRLAISDPAVREGLVEALAVVLEDDATSRVVHARAADALAYLGGGRARDLLRPRVADPSEIVRFYAARSLHRLGQPEGTLALEKFRHHRAEGVRMLAVMALQGALGQGDSRK